MDRACLKARTSYLALIFACCMEFGQGECEFRVTSVPGEPQNGTFTAPTLENPNNHSHMCVYIFHAGPHQKVELNFVTFNLRGIPPECKHEYLDLYSEIQSSDTTELINSPFGGRFCGFISPRPRISLYRTIAFSFYTDKNNTVPEIFSGRYAFINDSEYQVGTTTPSNPCSFIIQMKVKRKGIIVSPTYPGTYPKPLFCSFLFLGTPGQRVHLEFRDFDLFSGGPHCPFDFVRVYDGKDNSSALIGTFCGQHRNLMIYSSNENLFVTFEAIQRTANTQNRGFKGIFEFSESFVKLDFIGKHGGEHILGSECDQKILSKKESTGYVYSPNYPFPYIPKTVCRYFIYGLQDVQNLERVRLEFITFDIPKVDKTDNETECKDRSLKIYLKGQETTDAYDKYDYELCGEGPQPSMVSEGPRLVMMFTSGESQGRGFKAKYTFETEYLISGTAAPNGSCIFSYFSSVRKQGEFNSPRYPANYPSSTNCTYIFVGLPSEQTVLIFDQFKVRAELTDGTSPYGVREGDCQEDYIEIYDIYRDGKEIRLGRYCNSTSPGPIVSGRGSVGLKIFFTTDDKNVYSGFKARYSFESTKLLYTDFGTNISNSPDGVIQSPDFPKYTNPTLGQAAKICNWFIGVRPNHRILLQFDEFILEGDMLTRGCPATVLRMWLDVAVPIPIEVCGETLPNKTYLSVANEIRLSFVVADKSAGAKGFNLTWTEVGNAGELSSLIACDEFKCGFNDYCISEKLRCNNRSNCGLNDTSDEDGCYIEEPTDWMTFGVTSGAVGFAVIFLILCLMCQRRAYRKRHKQMLPSGIRAYSGRQHVCDELGQRFASVDSV